MTDSVTSDGLTTFIEKKLGEISKHVSCFIFHNGGVHAVGFVQEGSTAVLKGAIKMSLMKQSDWYD